MEPTFGRSFAAAHFANADGARFETLMFQLKDRVKFSHGMNAEQLLAWVNSEISRAPIRFEATHGQNITLDAFAQEMPDQGFVISFTDVSSERMR